MQRRFDNFFITSLSTEALHFMENTSLIQQQKERQKRIFATSAKQCSRDVFQVLTPHTYPLIIAPTVSNTYTRVSNYHFCQVRTIFLWTMTGIFYIQHIVILQVGMIRRYNVLTPSWRRSIRGSLPGVIFYLDDITIDGDIISVKYLGPWQMVDNGYVRVPTTIPPLMQ